MSIEHADFDGIERLALVLGGEIVSTFDDPSQVGAGPRSGTGARQGGLPDLLGLRESRIWSNGWP